MTVRAVCAGLGEIGQGIARAALDEPDIDVVGAVDATGRRIGRPLREVLGGGAATDVLVGDDLAAELERTRPDVVLLATTSRFEEVRGQVRCALDAGAAVVSTCEELSYPWDRAGADELDQRAVAAGRAVLATGVNPGFVMDLLPAVLSLPCTDIESVTVQRVVDLTRRRTALRERAGVGLDLDEFHRRAAGGGVGHLGLDCSARILARAVGVTDRGWPVVTVEPLLSDAGEVIGVRQVTGYEAAGGEPAVSLSLEMAMGRDREYDRIWIAGQPPVNVELEGGVAGDAATAAMVVHAVAQVVRAPGGLKTVLDLPPARPWAVAA